MRYVLVSLAFAGSLFSSSLTSANIFEHDARIRVTHRQNPLHAIGKLQNPYGGWCTATLISRDLILTAAHCFLDPETGEQIPGEFIFSPGYIYGRDNAWSRVSHVSLGTRRTKKEMGKDWAIGHLETPIGDKYGWFDICLEFDSKDGARSCLESVPRDREYQMVSYSFDLTDGQFPVVERGCRFRSYHPTMNVFFHDCSGLGGASGSPIFFLPDAQAGSRPSIVAIFTASFAEKEQVEKIPYSLIKANIGVPTDSFVPKLREILGPEFKTSVPPPAKHSHEHSRIDFEV